MRAIILAAGRGSRMQSLTENRPKCLLEWQGRALLDWQTEALRLAGVPRIGIVTGFARESLRGRGLFEFVNSQWATTSMVQSLLCADDWLKRYPCIVSYSDIVYSPKVLKDLVRPANEILVASNRNWRSLWSARFDDILSDAEAFSLDERGYITQIGGRPASASDIQGQYMGIMQFQPDSWDVLKQFLEPGNQTSATDFDMTGWLGRAAASGRPPLRAVVTEGAWAEFDQSTDFAASLPLAEQLLSEFREYRARSA